MARTKAPQKPSEVEQPRRSTRSRPALVVVEPTPEPKRAKKATRKRKGPEGEAEDMTNINSMAMTTGNEASPSATPKRVRVEESFNPNRTTILSLPAELIQNICLELPFTRDAIAVHLSNSKLSASLDNFFWYQRQLTRVSAQLNKGSLTYNPETSYLDKCLRAYYGWTGGRLGDGIQHNIERPPKPSSKPKNVIFEKPLTTRQTRWKKLSLRERDIYTCQICCFHSSRRYYTGFRLSLCNDCLDSHVITKNRLTFLSLPLRKSGIRRQPTLKGLEPEYIWISDLDPLAIEKYGKGIRELLKEHKQSKADKDARSKAYLQRQKDNFVEYAMTLWSLPEYNEFRTILTTEVMRTHFTISTNHYRFFSQSARTRISYTDKPPEWHQERFENQIQFLSRTTGVGCLRWGFYAEFNTPGGILQAIRTFHMRRLMAAHDAGTIPNDPDIRGFANGLYLPSTESELPTGWTTASDGKCLVGFCPECYHILCARLTVQRAELALPVAQDAELDFEATISTMQDFWEFCLRRGTGMDLPNMRCFSALGLIQHYAEYHTVKTLSLERNEGGVWWEWLRGVQECEPKRVWSLDEVDGIVPLPGGVWNAKVYKNPPVPYEPATGKGAMRECQRALMDW